MGRNIHADGLGAATGSHQDGGLLGQALETLQGLCATGFGGDRQPASAVSTAQYHDPATPQLRQGALDGGKYCFCRGMNRTRTHAFLLACRGLK